MLKAVRNGTEGETLAKLTMKQERSIAAVLSSRTVEEGIARAKISKTQWYRWLSDPGFKAAFEKRRHGLLDDALHTLRASLTKAVGVLDGIMDQNYQHPATRLRAALSVIEIVTNADMTADLLKRIEAIEKIIGGKK